MTLNFGVLPKVLTSPKSAFEGIKGSTTMMDGIMMYVILAVLGILIGMVVMMATPIGGALMTGDYMLYQVVTLVLGAIGFVLTGIVTAMLAKALFKGAGDNDATVGFLGYAQVVGLVIGLLAAIIGMLMFGGMAAASTSPAALGTAMAGGIGVMAIIVIIGVLWALYVASSAVAVANGIGVMTAFVAYLISAILVGIVMAPVTVAVLSALGMGMFGVVAPIGV